MRVNTRGTSSGAQVFVVEVFVFEATQVFVVEVFVFEATQVFVAEVCL